jgi:hypothetical protein
MIRTSAPVPPYASKMPSTLPAAASNRDSVNPWRSRRNRPAPSETRNAISRWRAAPRVSSRLATLVHAISSSSATTTISSSTGFSY